MPDFMLGSFDSGKTKGGTCMDKFEQLLSRFAPQVLSIVRIMTGLLLLQHPLSKFFGFPVATNRPALFALGWFAGAIEIVFGSLFLVGAWTRFVAFILSGELAFAYFIGHAPQGFWPVLNQGTPAILFCFLFLYFSAAGPGAFSVSSAFRRSTATIAGFGGNHEALHHSR